LNEDGGRAVEKEAGLNKNGEGRWTRMVAGPLRTEAALNNNKEGRRTRMVAGPLNEDEGRIERERRGPLNENGGRAVENGGSGTRTKAGQNENRVQGR